MSPMSQTIPTLSVSHLKTQFATRSGIVKAVDEVSFSVMPGQIMGLVGESGSGKSMTGYSIMGLIDRPGEVVGGSILLQGEELRGLPAEAMRAVRGERIAMIFQDPMMTLPGAAHRHADDGSRVCAPRCQQRHRPRHG
jgi:peptide/nickel transport system ATP-binding protein